MEGERIAAELAAAQAARIAAEEEAAAQAAAIQSRLRGDQGHGLLPPVPMEGGSASASTSAMGSLSEHTSSEAGAMDEASEPQDDDQDMTMVPSLDSPSLSGVPLPPSEAPPPFSPVQSSVGDCWSTSCTVM